jgi:hypothetical protein
MKGKILEQSLTVSVGDYVEKFDGSNHTLGTMILKFDNKEEMLHMMDHMEDYFRVFVDPC